jgi:hypothetical protein
MPPIIPNASGLKKFSNSATTAVQTKTRSARTFHTLLPSSSKRLAYFTTLRNDCRLFAHKLRTCAISTTRAVRRCPTSLPAPPTFVYPPETSTLMLPSQAQVLVKELRWLNRDFTSRWRTVVFSRSSPVSWRWRATLRALSAFAFVLLAWCMWIALRGAYRAHRQRLVWGERLIS